MTKKLLYQEDLKHTIHLFFGEKNIVVFVTVTGTKHIGFLTVKEPCFIIRDGKEYVDDVYFPQSLQFAGDLHWFDRSAIEMLDLSADKCFGWCCRPVWPENPNEGNYESEKSPSCHGDRMGWVIISLTVGFVVCWLGTVGFVDELVERSSWHQQRRPLQ